MADFSAQQKFMTASGDKAVRCAMIALSLDSIARVRNIINVLRFLIQPLVEQSAPASRVRLEDSSDSNVT
jgi:hypothetical protein